MDILNFISWIKRGDYKATLPTDTTNLLAVGAKVDSRDDSYLPLAINAENLQSVYDKGTVTQATNLETDVTLNNYSGVITTVSSTLGATLDKDFDLINSKITADSRILLSVVYPTAKTGWPQVRLGRVVDGVCTIQVTNLHGSAALNDALKIHFMILK